MLYVSHHQEELLVSSQHFHLCRLVFYSRKTPMDFNEAIQRMNKDFPILMSQLHLVRCGVFFQNPHNTAVVREPPEKPLHWANPVTELPALKAPFPRFTMLTEVFHKDWTPKISSHQLWESLTDGRRRGMGRQYESKETPYRKAWGIRASSRSQGLIYSGRVPMPTVTS